MVIPPSTKAITGMATYPVLLLIKTSSREQYSRPTSGGIRYLALKPSIPAGESTIFSSLPIPLILGDAKTIYLRNNAGKGNGKGMCTYERGTCRKSSRGRLRRLEHFERESTGVLWVLECLSKNEKNAFEKSYISGRSWTDILPPREMEMIPAVDLESNRRSSIQPSD